MINRMISQVAEFHDAFGVKRGNVDVKLRYDLFKEEFEEYKDAKDLVERADAICDMLYIACGTLDVHKLKYNPLISEIENEKLDCLINIDYFLNAYKLHKKPMWIHDMIEYILDLADYNNILDILPELFNEVHLSNISKLDDNGKPIINELNSEYYDSRKPLGKVLKSKNFFEPKLKEILIKHSKINA